MERSPTEAQKQGALFYVLPDRLDLEQVDPLLRDAVSKINASDWVWTAESCQGHPDAMSISDTGWSHNTEPFLRLVCHQDDEPRMLTALIRSLEIPEDQLDEAMEGLWNQYQPARIYRSQRGEYAEVMVYLPAATAGARNGGIAVFERFGHAVARER